jgi:hypothetical protein
MSRQMTDHERTRLMARVEEMATAEILAEAIEGLLMVEYVCAVTMQERLAHEIDQVAGQLEIWRSLEQLRNLRNLRGGAA